MRQLLLMAVLLLPLAVGARMYQWVNPNSGRVELSGTPPAWYRTNEGGPRIQVFQNGQMVDDTAITLNESQSDKLREAAFEEFEIRRRAEQVKKLERAARREKARRARAEESTVGSAPEQGKGDAADASIEELPDTLDQGTIDRLKNLIQSWDKQLTGTN